MDIKQQAADQATQHTTTFVGSKVAERKLIEKRAQREREEHASKITTASPFPNYRASGIRLGANTWGVWLTNWNTRKIHYMTVTD